MYSEFNIVLGLLIIFYILLHSKLFVQLSLLYENMHGSVLLAINWRRKKSLIDSIAFEEISTQVLRR